MISPNQRWLGGFVLAVALLPSLARAQSMARSFEELQGILKAEEIVVVMDKTGQKTWGKVAEVSTTSLVLVLPENTPSGVVIWTSGAKRASFAEDTVAEILRSDLSGRTETRIYLALARSFQDLRRTLKLGQTVRVTDASGRQTKGRVADVSASSLVISTVSRTGLTAVPEKRAFAQDAITEIRAADPWWNGMLIGAGIGVGLALSPSLLGADPSETGFSILSVLAIGLGATIGGGLDALIGDGKVLYVSPQQTQGVTLSPVLGKDRQGVLVSVRF